MNLKELPRQAIQSFVEFWTKRDARERAMLSAAAAVVALVLTYALLFAPALAAREQLNKNLPKLRQEVAQLQTLSKQAAAISAKPATPPPAMTRESIEAALARNSVKPQSVTLTGDFAKVQLASASFAGMLATLDHLQKNALLSVVDANIVALPQPDMVNATFTLRQQRNE